MLVSMHDVLEGTSLSTFDEVKLSSDSIKSLGFMLAPAFLKQNQVNAFQSFPDAIETDSLLRLN